MCMYVYYFVYVWLTGCFQSVCVCVCRGLVVSKRKHSSTIFHLQQVSPCPLGVSQPPPPYLYSHSSIPLYLPLHFSLIIKLPPFWILLDNNTLFSSRLGSDKTHTHLNQNFTIILFSQGKSARVSTNTLKRREGLSHRFQVIPRDTHRRRERGKETGRSNITEQKRVQDNRKRVKLGKCGLCGKRSHNQKSYNRENVTTPESKYEFLY